MLVEQKRVWAIGRTPRGIVGTTCVRHLREIVPKEEDMWDLAVVTELEVEGNTAEQLVGRRETLVEEDTFVVLKMFRNEP